MNVAFQVQHPAPRAAWGQVLADDEMSLADHSPAWMDAMCATGRYHDVSRHYRWADGRQFVLPMVARARLPSTRSILMSPPPAWGIGGLIGTDQDREVVQAVVDDVAGLGAIRVQIRPDPLRAELWATAYHQNLIRIPRYAHVADLNGTEQELLAGFTKHARRDVRRAKQVGVEVRTVHGGGLLHEHYRLYLLSVERWAAHQNEPLPMARWRARRRDPLRKLQSMAAHLGQGFCHHVAYLDGQAIASNIVLSGPVAHGTRSAMDHDLAGPARAGDALLETEVLHARSHGSHHFQLGESGRSPSLAHFKEKCGAVGRDYDEIRIERVPLTAIDATARSVVKRAIRFRDV